MMDVYTSNDWNNECSNNLDAGVTNTTESDDVVLCSVKLYLTNSDGSREARRISVPRTAMQSLDNFRALCLPAIGCDWVEEVDIFWNDEDGDELRITNEGEFKEAICFQKDVHILKFNVKKSKITNNQTNVSSEQVCGCCQASSICCLKCISCTNYYLCNECSTKDVHSHHILIRVPHQNDVCLPQDCNTDQKTARESVDFNRMMKLVKTAWDYMGLPDSQIETIASQGTLRNTNTSAYSTMGYKNGSEFQKSDCFNDRLKMAYCTFGKYAKQFEKLIALDLTEDYQMLIRLLQDSDGDISVVQSLLIGLQNS